MPDTQTLVTIFAAVVVIELLVTAFRNYHPSYQTVQGAVKGTFTTVFGHSIQVPTAIIIAAVIGVVVVAQPWKIIPTPGPEPDPVIVVDPVIDPEPIANLKVLIVEESGDRAKLTSGQRNVILSTADGSVRSYIKSIQGGWRVLDKDSATDREAAWVKEARTHVGPEMIPALVYSDGISGTVCPLPETEEETLELLKKLGG